MALTFVNRDENDPRTAPTVRLNGSGHRYYILYERNWKNPHFSGHAYTLSSDMSTLERGNLVRLEEARLGSRLINISM